MALIQSGYGPHSRINTTDTPLEYGKMYFTSDEKELYADIYDENDVLSRVRVNENFFDYYGTCSTEANVAEKAVVCVSFALISGAKIAVFFANANTANNPTLNVNSTGAKTIKIDDSTVASADMWSAGSVVRFTYNGINWIMDNGSMANLANNAVPKTTTINGHTLNSDITITKSDVGLGNVDNTADADKEVLSATKLATARDIQTDLSSNSAASFDGSADVTPGVTGVLPVANGGTNANNADDARVNLGAAAAVHTHNSSEVYYDDFEIDGDKASVEEMIDFILNVLSGMGMSFSVLTTVDGDVLTTPDGKVLVAVNR